MKPLLNLTGSVIAAMLIPSFAFAAAVVPPPPATTTLDDIRAKAESGNIAAQVAIGGMYEKGDGFPKDFAEAAKWFRKAADQGSADA